MARLLSHLFRGPMATPPSSSPSPRRETKDMMLLDGEETLEVVGESFHQDELWEIVGGRRPDPIRHETYAVLLPEHDNPEDANAIAVLIQGRPVGHLSLANAAIYRDGLLRLMEKANQPIALHAAIVGGGPREDGLGRLGVFLDHDPVDFGLKPRSPFFNVLRTGWSAAAASDDEDDRYDLSWRARLSPSEAKAIPQLRALLAEEHQPISRHYMFCELEHALYRCRDAFPSALADFDVVCEQHHQEMNSIRPALLDKFGVIPVIETYQQAAIRCAKARRWHEAQRWAERGIAIYGGEAARPEVVDDLRRRLERAKAKREASDQPRTHRPRAATVSAATARPPEKETLVCIRCGASFERVRSRGRKPKLCPSCREHATDTEPRPQS